jgi:Reverse transcriptase (RNA-dependent DNA polymerase)
MPRMWLPWQPNTTNIFACLKQTSIKLSTHYLGHFLTNAASQRILTSMGFMNRKISAERNISSLVKLSGRQENRTKERHSTRDPFSPYLFILAADFLPRGIEILTQQKIMQKPFLDCIQCLLYADDTLFIMQPSEEQISALKIILQLYGQISGLQVNLAKSELLITSVENDRVQWLANIMGCKAASFPLKYLGMPFSDKKLRKIYYRQLMQKIHNKLSAWKASLLSSGGRLTLLNSTLTSMPLFFMSTFFLPKWVIKEIDKIRRKFLWHGHKEHTANQSMNLVSWGIVIKSKHMGG